MLTPVDIENKDFAKVFRGYDVYEVDEFMRNLLQDYEKLYRENAELKEKNANLTETIASYKGMEETMQNAILVAQRTAEDIKQNAYERSETIIKDAERRAGEAIHKANQSIGTLEKTYLNMQSEMNGFRAKMSALLSTYMQLLSELPEQMGPKHALFASISEAEEKEAVCDKKEEKIPEIKEEPAPEPEPVDYGDTAPFVLPKEEPAEKEAEEAAPGGFQAERKINPVVEELLQKKHEQQAEESFGIKKETAYAEAEPKSATINIENLQNFDVFKDDTL